MGPLIATFAPGAGQFLGSFTGALFTGALPILVVAASVVVHHANGAVDHRVVGEEAQFLG